ncbi:Hydrogenase-3 nickel incorporation protein HypA [Desulfosporosinus acidiphilus SJ4]|uniref:Hydrogenase maturation factor HypA n=1 Tax=Desulfosporosinus acidiphilus (strain DSM 22704 / JCM 16185 / SJ4) TaxID=646529 RepID=I4D9B7_DESAJ|nr:Hydrogenase-3 nickel incorporation protein HypA [Desulfosporosinus acidiphilus SJ4]
MSNYSDNNLLQLIIPDNPTNNKLFGTQKYCGEDFPLRGDNVHEMSLMGGVFEVIDQTLSSHNVKRVLKVKIKVGELTNAEPDALAMAFEAYSKDTVCEGAELVVERVPLRGFCKNCRREFNVKTMCFLCPDCQSTSIEITQGEELLLESLEVE